MLCNFINICKINGRLIKNDKFQKTIAKTHSTKKQRSEKGGRLKYATLEDDRARI